MQATMLSTFFYKLSQSKHTFLILLTFYSEKLTNMQKCALT